MMTAFDRAWALLKRVILPESKEHWSPDMIMWHLKQRQWDPSDIDEFQAGREDNWRWRAMPRPKARTTHGFHGEPVPEDILANPPMAVPDVTAHTDEGWRKKIQTRQADDENTEARRRWNE